MSCLPFRRLCLVLAAGLTLAGCGELPRPFQPGPRDGVDLLSRLQDSRGVTVAPVYDAPPAVSTPLAERLAAAFRKQDVPATAQGALVNGFLLEGWSRLENEADGRADLAIDWRLTDPAGNEVAQSETRRQVRLVEWTGGAAPLLDTIAAAAAPGFLTALIGDAPAPTVAPARSVAIAVTGAPGDGNDALRRAFASVLRNAGLPTAASPATATVRLSGKVELAHASDSEDNVKLTWTLRDAAADKEIAVMTQENRVPRDRLSGRWGALAFDVALAMRDDIIAAVRRLDDAADAGRTAPPALR